MSARPARHPATYLAPLALGDSTMIFALPSLAAEGFDANARGCRQFPEAIALLAALRHANSLPHLVVLALGANGSVTDAYVRATLAVLGHTRQLVLVTPLEAGGQPGSDAVAVRAEARRHPDQIHALDWVAYSAGHAAWFQPDRLHLTFAGARAFAHLLGEALPLAPPPGHGPSAAPTLASCLARAAASGGIAPARPAGSGPPGASVTGTPPTRPVASASPLGPAVPRLDPANPLVSLSSTSPGGGGLLATDAQIQSAAVELTNHNPFPVAGTIRLATIPGPGQPSAASPLTCVSLAPDATGVVRIGLGGGVAQLLRLEQRRAVRVTADLFDRAGDRGTVTGLYLLERPPRA